MEGKRCIRIYAPDFDHPTSSTFHSCCVDEVAAQHVEADLIIHYGRACLSQLSPRISRVVFLNRMDTPRIRTSRLPVLYVFGRKEIDVETVVDGLVDVYLADHPIYALSQGVALKQITEPEKETQPEAETVITLRHDVVYTHRAR